MKSLHVEIMLGHNVGLAENYYRPSEDDLLTDYLKAAPDLTILENPATVPSEDVETLKTRVKTLEDEIREIRKLALKALDSLPNSGN